MLSILGGRYVVLCCSCGEVMAMGGTGIGGGASDAFSPRFALLELKRLLTLVPVRRNMDLGCMLCGYRPLPRRSRKSVRKDV